MLQVGCYSCTELPRGHDDLPIFYVQDPLICELDGGDDPDREEEAEGPEEDIDDLMDRRERFVKKSIKRGKQDATVIPLAQNRIATQARKDVIAGFIQEVALVKSLLLLNWLFERCYN